MRTTTAPNATSCAVSRDSSPAMRCEGAVKRKCRLHNFKIEAPVDKAMMRETETGITRKSDEPPASARDVRGNDGSSRLGGVRSNR